MGKVFTTKQLRLRARAKRRLQSLKVNPAPVQRKPTQEESNRSVIAAIEAKMNA